MSCGRCIARRKEISAVSRTENTRTGCALRTVLHTISFLCLISWAGLSLGAEPDLAKAEALMRAGKPAEAYALLAPFEDKYAGDPRYDYVLGIAALDSGRPDRATLVFERVLAVSPNFAGARLDMARAYFQLGDMARARTEFDTLLAQSPPEAARVTILNYLAEIARREEAKLTVRTAYVEATFGRDSNVNNSTSQTQVTVPALGNLVFALDPTNVKRADDYWLFAAGADITHEFRPGWAVFGGVSGRYRQNSSEDQFDYKSADIRGGIAMVGEANIVRATVSGEDYYLDHQPNRNSLGFGLDWRHVLDQENHINVFGQSTRFRYEQSDLTINNFDLYIAGVGWMRLFRDGRSLLSATLIFGREDAVNDRADGNKDILGARLGGQLNLRDNVDIFASVGYQKGKYDKQNAAFQATRDDKQTDAVLGLSWRIDNAWSLRPQILYVRNDSNIPIYGYKRTDISITLRRDFR